MQPVNLIKSAKARFISEVVMSGILAFIIVSVVVSATSPAPMSITYMMNLV